MASWTQQIIELSHWVNTHWLAMLASLICGLILLVIGNLFRQPSSINDWLACLALPVAVSLLMVLAWWDKAISTSTIVYLILAICLVYAFNVVASRVQLNPVD